MVLPCQLPSKQIIPNFLFLFFIPFNLISLRAASVASVPADNKKAFQLDAQLFEKFDTNEENFSLSRYALSISSFQQSGSLTPVNLTGTIDPAASTTVTGVGTQFTSEILVDIYNIVYVGLSIGILTT